MRAILKAQARQEKILARQQRKEAKKVLRAESLLEKRKHRKHRATLRMTETSPAAATTSVTNTASNDAAAVFQKRTDELSAQLQSFSLDFVQQFAALQQQLLVEQAARVKAEENLKKEADKNVELTNSLQDVAAQLAHTNLHLNAAQLEKQALAEQVAAHVDTISTFELQLADAKDTAATAQQELAAVQQQHESMVSTIFAAMKPAAMKKAVTSAVDDVKNLGETISAVGVAVAQEVTEAVQGSNNYQRPRVRAQPAPPASATDTTSETEAKEQGSSFIQAMDEVIQHTQPIVKESNREAFRKLTNMGFVVSLDQVKGLMAQNNDDVSAVINELLQQ